MSLFKRHAFICTQARPDGHPKGPGCAAALPDPGILNAMWERLINAGVGDVRINMAGCLGACDKGPVVVVYPDAVWYSPKTTEDFLEIVDSHLIQGTPVDRLKMAA